MRLSREEVVKVREKYAEQLREFSREVFGPSNDEYLFLLYTGTPWEDALDQSTATYERLKAEFLASRKPPS